MSHLTQKNPDLTKEQRENRMDSFFKFLKVDPNSKGLFKPNITELDRDMTELNAD